jgi:methyl-accepting chemotaxis protein
MDNYEISTADSINMAAEYMRFGFQSVVAASNQYVSDTALNDYLRNTGNKMELVATNNTVSKSLSSKKTSDEFISNIYIISDTAMSITTTQLRIKNDFYAGFAETENGKYLIANPMKTLWDGQDEYLDEKLQTGQKDYSMRLIRGFGKLDSVLIMDIKAEAVDRILADLSIDPSGILAVITPDGKEIINRSKDELLIRSPSPKLLHPPNHYLQVSPSIRKHLLPRLPTEQRRLLIRVSPICSCIQK